MAFLDVFCSISLISLAAFLQNTFVSSQAHRSTHIGDGFLLFHDVNHIMRSFLIHFA